jgi:hypothetical protein
MSRTSLAPLFFLLLLAAALPPGVSAQPAEGGFYPPQQAGVGGGGSWGLLRLQLPELDDRLAAMGLDPLPGWLPVSGGGGVFNIGHLQVGGWGWEGSAVSEATSGGLVRSARLDLSMTGLFLGWVKAAGMMKLTLGGTLGLGHIDLLLRRGPEAVPAWAGVWDYYESAFSGSVDASALDTSARMDARFFWLEPSVSLRYWFIPLVAVDVCAVYSWGRVGAGKLRYEGEKIPDAPALDLSGLGFRVGIFLGF